MVKPSSEYFIIESIDNLKRSLSAYNGHLSKAIDSFNAILMVQQALLWRLLKGLMSKSKVELKLPLIQ